MMKKTILTLVATSTIYAGGAFSLGSKNIRFIASADNSFGNTYTVLGVNANYFVLDNLSVGATYVSYLGGTPSINQMTIPVTYHLSLGELPFVPYLGAFYSKTFIESPYEDYDTYGGRIGASVRTSGNSYLSVGWVQEFGSSSNKIDKRGYPEISVGISF